MSRGEKDVEPSVNASDRYYSIFTSNKTGAML
jgi:hypothetical protein